MANLSSPKPPKQRPLWQVLVAPLFVLSMVGHGLLLIMPVPSRPSVEETANNQNEELEEEVPEELEAVDILDLASIAAPEPPPPEPPPEAPPPEPAAAAPPPSQPVAPLPEDLEAPPPEPEPELENSPPPPDPEAPPSFDPGPTQQAFVGSLSNLQGASYGDDLRLLALENFRGTQEEKLYTASFFVTDINTNLPQPVAGARTARLLDFGLDRNLDLLTDTYAAQALTFQEVQPRYGGQRLYQLYNAEGDPVILFSLVELEGSVLLVVWNGDPR